MDKQIQKIAPDYKRIYTDMLKAKKLEGKDQECDGILSKSKLTTLDVIHLNKKLFGFTNKDDENQKHRSYDIPTIIKILNYQKTHNLNNTELANHFKMSRNTIKKWKDSFNFRIVKI